MDINDILSRFLDGRTTPEEEDRLADYFRHADPLPDKFKPYRDMFAYFDSGMPLGQLPEFDATNRKARPQRRIAILWSAVATVAAAAAMLLVMWPATDSSSNGQPNHTCTTASADKPNADSASVEKKNTPDEQVTPQHDQRYVRKRYDVAPPRIFIASAADSAHTVPPPTTPAPTGTSPGNAYAASQQQKLMANYKSVEEEQQQLENDIADIRRMVNEAKQTMVASESFVDEYK